MNLDIGAPVHQVGNHLVMANLKTSSVIPDTAASPILYYEDVVEEQDET